MSSINTGMSPFSNEDPFASFEADLQANTADAAIIEEQTQMKAVTEIEAKQAADQKEVSVQLKYNLQATKLQSELFPGRDLNIYNTKMVTETNKAMTVAMAKFNSLEMIANQSYEKLNTKEAKQFNQVENQKDLLRQKAAEFLIRYTKVNAEWSKANEEIVRHRVVLSNDQFVPMRQEHVDLEDNFESFAHTHVENGQRFVRFNNEERRQEAIGKNYVDAAGVAIVLNHENTRVLNDTEKKEIKEKHEALKNEIRSLQTQQKELITQYEGLIAKLQDLQQRQQQILEKARSETRTSEVKTSHTIRPFFNQTSQRVEQAAHKRTEKDKENVSANLNHRSITSQSKAKIKEAKNRDRVQKGGEKRAEEHVKSRQKIDESKLESRERIHEEDRRQDNRIDVA